MVQNTSIGSDVKLLPLDWKMPLLLMRVEVVLSAAWLFATCDGLEVEVGDGLEVRITG